MFYLQQLLKFEKYNLKSASWPSNRQNILQVLYNWFAMLLCKRAMHL